MTPAHKSFAKSFAVRSGACVVLLLTAIGCGTIHHNLNDEPGIIESGMVGQRYSTTRDLRLLKITSLSHLYLTAPENWVDVTTEKVVGEIPKGTLIQVVRVEDEVRLNVLIETHDMEAIGEICDGTMKGKEVVLNWQYGDKEVKGEYLKRVR